VFIKLLNLSAVLLLIAGLFLRPQAVLRTALTWSICAIAVLFVIWMLRKGQRIWAMVFAAVALLFNPIFALGARSMPMLAVDGVALVAFLTLAFFQSMPQLTAESITSEEPRRSSL
jgi:hypothetical protein